MILPPLVFPEQTLADYDTAKITVVISFIVQAPGINSLEIFKIFLKLNWQKEFFGVSRGFFLTTTDPIWKVQIDIFNAIKPQTSD